MSISVRLLTIIMMVALSSAAHSSDNYDVEKMSAEEAYKHGKLLRAQFKNTEARAYLKYSADNNYPDGAYAYAMETMGNHDKVRATGYAREYLVKAAESGNRSALKYLYRNGDWLTHAKRNKYKSDYYNSLIELGAVSPGLAYLHLSDYFHKSDRKLSEYYLDKAMEFELPSAYMTSAERLENGEGDYFFESERVALSRERYKHAAVEGYIPAIKRFVAILESRGKFQEALEWREVGVVQGDITSLVTLGNIYSGNSPRYHFVKTDLPKAKAYFELYLENAGQDRLSSVYQQAETNYKETVDKIAEVQLPQSQALKDELSEVSYFYNHDYLWNTY
ncbi:sel1 repeat family protein [Vibrio tubiashii]|uniref:sel1 repeat family protein n=1 Tax=Vibrio tubiashii TaxID=29498 RepID=UPI00234EA216|nr:sel1 repeat family protein [Vibrio tubiashii]WCP68021.1 sel1 repeat family protein [Vibrio tubiashii]